MAAGGVESEVPCRNPGRGLPEVVEHGAADIWLRVGDVPQ